MVYQQVSVQVCFLHFPLLSTEATHALLSVYIQAVMDRIAYTGYLTVAEDMDKVGSLEILFRTKEGEEHQNLMDSC